ncbi:MAG: cupin domain-containing protein [Pseudomonadota bacterium]
MSNDSINGDLTQRVSVDTETLAFTPSPSGTVWRKRVHLVGPPEAGQVTSLVRYQPDSSFPAHDHPEGEEILVLEGVFSDEHGDWPAGTYLLNPEGFRHAPFSKPGCLLLVKLRQFPGIDREHVVIASDQLSWEETSQPGISSKPLYQQAGFSDQVSLERWAPGAAAARRFPDGVEYFVLEGSLEDEAGSYSQRSWLRLPAGASHQPMSSTGCTLYVKTGGLPYLRAG